MTDHVLPGKLLTLLRSVDTPTVCNAIEVAQGCRGFDRFTRGTLLSSSPAAAPLVGFARTAKIAGRVPARASAESLRVRRMDYFRSMAEGPRPSLAVVEDTDYPQCVAAWWGEVHAAVHSGLGLAGALTNGVMRDLDAMSDGFPVLSGSIGPSHAHVHVVDIGTPVSVFGLEVSQGQLIHADRHGAVAIPADILPVLATAIETVAANEAIVLGPAREPGFTIDRLEEVWAKFESARQGYDMSTSATTRSSSSENTNGGL